MTGTERIWPNSRSWQATYIGKLPIISFGLEKGDYLMTLINRVGTAPIGAIEVPESVPQTQGSPTPPVSEQPMETSNPADGAGKKLERDLEAAYFRDELDNAGHNSGVGVLYDRKAVPDARKDATATKAAGSQSTTVQPAGTSDELNGKVESEAAEWVGKPTVGKGECYDLADAVLKATGAKSARDFDKITGSRDQNYKWGAPIPLKDVRPGDVLQFRDQRIVIETSKTIKKDGVVIEKSPRPSIEEHIRGPQHTSIVLSNDGNGKFTVAEQHVIDPKHPRTLSSTVRKNSLYTQSGTTTDKRVSHEGGHEIVEETTVKITVTGKTWAYRPQQKTK